MEKIHKFCLIRIQVCREVNRSDKFEFVGEGMVCQNIT